MDTGRRVAVALRRENLSGKRRQKKAQSNATHLSVFARGKCDKAAVATFAFVLTIPCNGERYGGAFVVSAGVDWLAVLYPHRKRAFEFAKKAFALRCRGDSQEYFARC